MKKRKEFNAPGPLPGEFLDRFTILIKQAAEDPKHYEDQVQKYVEILKENGLDGDLLRALCELQMENLNVWFFEAQIRAGVEKTLPAEEVVEIALGVRKHNAIRVTKVNRINELFGVDCKAGKKIDYGSKSNVDTV